MRPNTVKRIWARGEAAVNGWLQIPSSFSAELVAHQGFDSIVVDLQHGMIDFQVAVTMLQAISTTPAIPLARVAWNDLSQIMKILDAGAYGVICPMVNTAAEAEALVRACRYPPFGIRSWGPTRATLYAGSGYDVEANDEILVMPMIETVEALTNLDAIVATPGVDAVYVGPSDLALSLGFRPTPDQVDQRVVDAQRRIVEACRRHGKIAGIHCGSAAYAIEMIAAGYQFVTLGTDRRYLTAQASAETAAVRKAGVKAGVKAAAS